MPASAVIFNVLELAGADLRRRPYLERRTCLEDLLYRVGQRGWPVDRGDLGRLTGRSLRLTCCSSSPSDGLAEARRTRRLGQVGGRGVVSFRRARPRPARVPL